MAPLRNSRSRNCSGSEYRTALKTLESKSTQAIEIPFRLSSQIQDRSGVVLLRQTDSTAEVLEERFGPDRVEHRINTEENTGSVPVRDGRFEGSLQVRNVSQAKIDRAGGCWIHIHLL